MPKNRQQTTSRPESPVILEVDGRQFRLKWDFNAVADVEMELGNGTNLLHAVGALAMNTMSAWQLRGLLYATLRPLHPHVPASPGKPEQGIDLQGTGALIRSETMPAIRAALCSVAGVPDIAAALESALKSSPQGNGPSLGA